MAKRHRHDPSLSSPISDVNAPTIFSHTRDSDSDSAASSTATSKKYNKLDPTLSSKRPTTPPVISCNLLPHCNRRPFTSYAEFESHYHQQHTNRCHECHRNFPSERYLTIHIAENHDVFNELKKEKGEKTFQCFVEGCDRLCSTPQKRRLHVIDKHGFPKNFYFRIVDYGIDNCNSLLRNPRRYSKGTHGKSGTSSDTSMLSSPESTRAARKSENPSGAGRLVESNEGGMKELERAERSGKVIDTDKDMQDVTDMMATVKLVPRHVRFGRGGGMVGFGSRR
ncbi:hypothetical protein EV426DRAFT_526740 [Tirmania nivea]|nr:hypothetical protein EV426DRAFT_526740 [Tirmania nivea]